MLTSLGVTDQHNGSPFLIHSQRARVWMVAALIAGFASLSKSDSHFSRGNPAARTRRTVRRRSRSSHSASSSSARNPR